VARSAISFIGNSMSRPPVQSWASQKGFTNIRSSTLSLVDYQIHRALDHADETAERLAKSALVRPPNAGSEALIATGIHYYVWGEVTYYRCAESEVECTAQTRLSSGGTIEVSNGSLAPETCSIISDPSKTEDAVDFFDPSWEVPNLLDPRSD